MGRDPAAVGVLAARAPPRRLRARPSGDAGRLRGPRPVHDRGRARAAGRVLPVAGVGHRAGHDRAQRRRRGRRPPGAAARPRAGCSARRSACAATGRCAARTSSRAAGRSSSRTTTTPTPTTRRSSASPCGGSATTTTRRPTRRASGRCAWLEGMQCARRRLGRVRRRQHPAALHAGCRSATSARSSTRRRRTSPPTCSSSSPPNRGVIWPRCAPPGKWLLDHQEPDGSWFGRWGANHVYGTGAALTALAAAGGPHYDRPIRRAAQWLEAHQNSDGGWGEDLRSYRDEHWVGRGESTAVADGVGAARLDRRARRQRRDRRAACGG